MTTRLISGYLLASAILVHGIDLPGQSRPRSLKDQLPRLKPTEPADAGKTFQLPAGFKMELVAHEPQVASPVAAAYDEDGRLYVVEMRDYPNPRKPGEPALGRVRLLDDRDGDSVYETATVFAEGLNWPTGIACWDGGVFVTAAPDILYLKDTDGDRKSDIRKVAYTGFVVYNVQALVNGLQWGVDNRIYGVTAANGGEIRPGDKPDATPVSVRGRDFRFDPRTGVFEAIAGTAQFGNTFDDWYNRFVCANRLVCGHVAMPAHALARNPHLPAARMVQDCAAEGSSEVLPMFQISPPEPWRVVRTKRYIDEGQKQPTSEMKVTGIFTSGTGATIYRGAAYPERYRGQEFIGNVAGNLVHRRSLEPKGATFTATRVDWGSEFLASTDNWFRPVNFVNAPDGTLHALDMYREVVEHPWSIPDDIKSHLDLYSGSDRGRIWRLTPIGFKRTDPPRLGRATAAELVAMLENPSAWWRETAQRLLYRSQDRAAIDPLRKLSRESKSPLARMHALWALDGLNALETGDILAALKSETAGLREHALRLAERRVKSLPELAVAVRAGADDADARVRFQTAIVLGELADDDSTAALLAIARRDAADPWTRLAVLSSAAERSHTLFAALLKDGHVPTASERDLLGQLAAVVGARNKHAEMERTLTRICDAETPLPKATREALFISLGDGLLRTGKTLQSLKLPAGSPVRVLLDSLIADASRTAGNPMASDSAKVRALQILVHADFTTSKPAFEAALDPRQPQEVQLAAVRALRSTADPGAPAVLLARWSSYTPAVRGEVVSTLSGRAAWAAALLDSVEMGTVTRSQIDSTRQALLKNHRDAKVRERAATLFTAVTSETRQKVLDRYKAAAEKAGDTAKGREVFRRECAGCHVAGSIGQNVGPSIASIGTKTASELLIGILDPNREVDPRYLNYTATLLDERTTSGIIAAESPTAITLRRSDGQGETILRSQILELRSTKLSLMPEGLEEKITPAEMADLLAFLLGPQ
jgi:putative membrane-bound dehydrogenase-like protein